VTATARDPRTASLPVPAAVRYPTFQCQTRIVAGLGSLATLDDELGRLGVRAVALIADRGLSDAGLVAAVAGQISSVPIASLALVDPNPDVAEVEAAAREPLAAGCDAVVVVGGGSALSAGKAVAIRLTNANPLGQYEGIGRLETRPAPTVAIPTTAGSGGEVSNALVLHEAGRARELVIRGPGYEPAVAILDATLLRGLPRAPLIYAGMDALTHALEAFWVHGRSSFTDANATAAADALLDELVGAVTAPTDAGLQRLLEASCAANLACGSSGLGLVHALSSAPSVPLPHGQQNAALLRHVARFNYAHLSARHQAYVDRLDDCYTALGLAPGFAAGEITPAQTLAMLEASRGHPFRLNNVRAATDTDVLEILRHAGAPTLEDQLP
jgi:alcohol dehydrogenase class IV